MTALGRVLRCSVATGRLVGYRAPRAGWMLYAAAVALLGFYFWRL